MSEKISIRGTQTQKNLLSAFANESQARNRYEFFAEVALHEGYGAIARFFEETAHNEREHARQFFSLLDGGSLQVTATYPSGVISTTVDNLRSAAESEYGEWSELYPEFAKVAEDEGFLAISKKFLLVSRVEQLHQERFSALLSCLESGAIFSKEVSTSWRCHECGHVHFGVDAPLVCPLCSHPQSFFEVGCDCF
ncbi:MAG: ferritin family protein [Rikenellaceae bacterium]